MLRNALIVLILVLLAQGVVDARMPKVGDQVYIATSSSVSAYMQFKGQITDIGDGLICLKCDSDLYHQSPYDMCIGVGSIASLTWI
jgi:hypothetical protein